MLKINRTDRTLAALVPRKLQDAGLKERFDIQAMIRNAPEVFFKEMGEDLLLLAEELKPAKFVDDRIDLLAVDRSGAVVIIELKRGSDRLQLLQSLAYASMIAEWTGEDLIRRRTELLQREANVVQTEIEDFLETEAESINETQRIVLIAEEYDYEVLTTAKWLSQRYEVDIRCYRIGLSTDAGNDFLTCTCIFPPPEISQHAISRRKGGRVSLSVDWTNWDEALASITNPAIVSFFRTEVAKGQENYLAKRILRYRHNGKRRWNVSAHREAAYVWQNGRFDDDIQIWTDLLGATSEIKPVKEKSCLRFFLTTETEFSVFKKAVTDSLNGIQFVTAVDDQSDEAES